MLPLSDPGFRSGRQAWHRSGRGSHRAGLGRIEDGQRFVEVAEIEETEAVTGLDPEGLNNTNRLRLHVFGDRGGDQARLVALLDNLGKGASGAAVQNLNIMLGLDEAAGLA